jgi:integrase
MSDNWKLSIGTSQGKEFVNLYHNNSRFRYWNGKAIGVKLRSSDNPNLLKSAFELKLLEGWRPVKRIAVKTAKKKTPPTIISELENGVNRVMNGNYSYHHKRDVQWVLREFKQYSTNRILQQKKTSELTRQLLEDFVYQSKWSDRTQKNVLTTLKCITQGEFKALLKEVKVRRVKSTLHKPIKDVKSLLLEIKDFNETLYLCCLLTYGCLLRPHQEIRLLRWRDVDFERGVISLSGERNKSGRNRIVPIPSYVAVELRKHLTASNRYVLRDNELPYSRDYLKVLWRRFKAQSTGLEDGVTLYSLRHSGALQVFEKTGSLQKLQQVMGHSDMKVSLTYLRNLEVKQLDVNDLPEL